jgi:Uma2 family endonuclease
MPDVSVVTRAQFADGRYPEEAVWRAYPELAVEVLSESNTEQEMDRKVSEYFEAGAS